jgi:hypothetical protein
MNVLCRIEESTDYTNGLDSYHIYSWLSMAKNRLAPRHPARLGLATLTLGLDSYRIFMAVYD